MALMNWKPEYSVGIPSIDTQHTKLISLINMLHDATAQGEGKEVPGKVLGKLLQYTKSHFAYEENMMKTQGYAFFAQHKALHDNLTLQLLDLEEKVRTGKSLVTMEVIKFLTNWLQDHMVGTDKAYSAYLIGQGAK